MKRTTATLKRQKKAETLIAPQFVFSNEIGAELKPLAARFALFCDDNVAEFYGKKLQAHLQKQGLDVFLFTFPAGEREKDRERLAHLEDALFSQKFGRNTCMIALGGGVTTDLIGYLASVFCRGVPLVFIPTTLLGMIDASIGGKTAINTRFGKNLIGSFYPADKVIIDQTLLASLPAPEWTNAAAEVVKYALIRSPQLFQALKTRDLQNPSQLEKILQECVQIKNQVVEADFEETGGMRRILNFGHTIAHALEKLENYRLPHGEAVAMGMLVEGQLSMKMGHLPAASLYEAEALIRSYPFKLQISSGVTPEKVLEAIQFDKKGPAKFVLLEKIGACLPLNGAYCTEVPPKILKEALDWMIAEFGEKK